MTNREKIKQEMTDPYLWHYICCESEADETDCICPIKKMCENEDTDAALKEFTAWLDEEVKSDGSV